MISPSLTPNCMSELQAAISTCARASLQPVMLANARPSIGLTHGIERTLDMTEYLDQPECQQLPEHACVSVGTGVLYYNGLRGDGQTGTSVMQLSLVACCIERNRERGVASEAIKGFSRWWSIE